MNMEELRKKMVTEKLDVLNAARLENPKNPKITKREALRLSIWLFNQVKKTIIIDKYYSVYPNYSHNFGIQDIKLAIILEATKIYGPKFVLYFRIDTAACPLCYYSRSSLPDNLIGCNSCPALSCWFHGSDLYAFDEEPCLHKYSPFRSVFVPDGPLWYNEDTIENIDKTIQVFEKALNSM